ncbi:MAG TPA: hypothetical protein PLR88_00490 [Bacteroidales bacterium]|nr:hypothetical protein [Bacteroidales bacterium]HPT20393.1 hypothetical protein [Bacteroidales bacterium]
MKNTTLSDQSIVRKNKVNVTRRNFISSCSACAACLAIGPMSFVSTSCSSGGKNKKMRIRVLYALHAPVQTKPDWPNVGFDFNPAMEKINASLLKNFPDFEFIPTLATGPEDAEKIIEKDNIDIIDGYIVYQMNCWNRVVQTVAKTGKPVLYADFQFGGSGGFLVYNSSFLSEKTHNVGFVASSRIEDLLAAVSCFNVVRKGGTPSEFVSATADSRIRFTKSKGDYKLKENNIKSLSPDECIYRLKNSKILAVRDQKAEIAKPVMDIPLEYIPFSEINDAWSKADKEESAAIVERWKKSALEIVNVDDATLLTSAAMYIGMKSILKKHRSNAITMNCLGGFYGGHIHAYPCLGFHELCNEGLIGACECDVRSTATMLAFSTLTDGRPGFISDPVIDTSKRQIIYAHCVAPNKMFGPQGEVNPFRIMTHSEDRSGASVQSVMPVNYMTTTLEIKQETKEILFHQAVAVDNDPDDRACRTKLCAEPTGDIEKLFNMWDKWGWHRVTFYGDLREPVFSLADKMGWKVIDEA